ncbi:MAG: hypothetical protein P4L55_20840 [Syntrophobacteraceae bacterium]|nr:hypothetical protein [Syntrophobacteraceae bacterium]
MARNSSLSEFFEDGKYTRRILAAGAALLLVLELGILLAVYNQSGLKTRVCITDSNARLIYESPGPTITSYEKMVFENNFGPLKNFTTQLKSQYEPFNYRAWILLAVGLPLGLMLLLFFMAQVWLHLLKGNPKDETRDEVELNKSAFTSFLSVSKNFSVLGVGFVIVLAMLILWLIPSILGDMASSVFRAVKQYPLFFIGVSAFAGGLLVWVIYLRYRLSRQMLENQVRIEKYRLDRLMIEQNMVPQLLPAHVDADETRTQFLPSGEH